MALLLTVVFTLLAAASAVVPQFGWKPKQEYTFTVEGRTSVGLGRYASYLEASSCGSSPASGLYFHGSLIIQSQTTDVLYCKMKFLQYHEMFGSEGQSTGNITTKTLPISDHIFIVKLKKGLVDNFKFFIDLEDWEINLIQGIITNIQYDLSGITKLPKGNDFYGGSYPKKGPIYSIMEDSIAGKCEVMYEIRSIPKSVISEYPPLPSLASICGSTSVLEIIKTTNYNNCQKRAEHYTGIPVNLQCKPAGSNCHSFWKRAVVSRLLGCGSRNFLLLASITDSDIYASLQFYQGTEATVQSNLNVTLQSVTESFKNMEPPPGPGRTVTGFVYQYANSPREEVKSSDSEQQESINTDRIKRFRHSRSPKSKNKKYIKPQLTTVPPVLKKNSFHVPSKDIEEYPYVHPYNSFGQAHQKKEIRETMMHQIPVLISEISYNFEKSENIQKGIKRAALLIDMFRLLSLTDIKSILYNMIKGPITTKHLLIPEGKVLQDTLIVCGTKPCFQILSLWIQQKIINDQIAAHILSILPSSLKNPDTDVVQQFYELVTSPIVQENYVTEAAGVLGFSHLLRVACVERVPQNVRFVSQEAGIKCTVNNTSTYLPWIIKKAKAESQLQRVYVAALGNTAVPTAFSPLLEVAQNSSVSGYVRSAAVFALHFFVLHKTVPVIPHLLSLFHDYRNPVVVRVAAFSMLTYTRPSITVWQRLALSTWFEPNPCIGAFIWSSLKSFATLQDPVYKEISQGASAVLTLAKPVEIIHGQPFNILLSEVNNELNEVLMDQISYSNSLEASHLYFRHTHRLGGFPQIIRELEMVMANPHSLFAYLGKSVTSEVKKEKTQDAIAQRSLDFILEHLKIVTRKLPESKGDIRMTRGSQKERIFPINLDSFKSIKDTFQKLSMFQSRLPFHVQNLAQEEMEISTVTEIGFPVAFRVRTLSVSRIAGNTRLNISKPQLSLQLNAMHAKHLLSELSVLPAWSYNEYVAVVHGFFKVHHPHTNFDIEGVVDPSLISKSHLPPWTHLQLNISFPEVTSRELINTVHHEVKPFVGRRDLTAYLPDITEVSKANPQFQEKNILSFPNVRVTYAVCSKQVLSFRKWLKEGVNVFGFPMMWRNLEWGRVIANVTDIPEHINISVALEGAEKNGSQWNYFWARNAVADALHDGPFKLPLRIFLFFISSDSSTEWKESKENSSGSNHILEINSPLTFTCNTNEQLKWNIVARDPFRQLVNTTISQNVFSHFISDMQYGRALVLNLNMSLSEGTNINNFNFIYAYSSNICNNSFRHGIYLNHQNNEKILVSGILRHPTIPLLDTKKLLTETVTLDFQVHATYLGNNSASYTSFEGLGKKNIKALNTMRSSPQAVACHKAEHFPNALLLDHNCKTVAEEALHLDEYKGNFFFSKKGTLDEKMQRLEGSFQSSSDGTITLLLFNDTYNDLNKYQIPHLTHILSVVSSSILRSRKHNSGTCGVEACAVTTYDGARMEYCLGNKWHVATADCSNSSEIAILARSFVDSMEVEIHLNDKEVLVLRPGLLLIVNGYTIPFTKKTIVEIKDHNGAILIHASLTEDPALLVTLPQHDMQLLYEKNLIIMTGSKNHGRFCGLCGDADGDPMDDMRNPQGTVESDIHIFAKSYALNVI